MGLYTVLYLLIFSVVLAGVLLTVRLRHTLKREREDIGETVSRHPVLLNGEFLFYIFFIVSISGLIIFFYMRT
jgi:hypothetical protein